MDGTLLDSEKIWDIALEDLANTLGGSLSERARQRMTGSSLAPSIAILHDDLGIDADPESSAAYLMDRTTELFHTDLVWRPGAAELLRAVHQAGIPAALVTSTHRRLTEIALNLIGRQHFAATVCGDEVGHPKPHPDPYLTALSQLGVQAGDSVAIEDSPLGIASAEAAGCAVIAVPGDIPIAPAPTRVVIDSMRSLGVERLEQILHQIRTA
jgi:HAD superfamily hydrolase (TIGR01509 family)